MPSYSDFPTGAPRRDGRLPDARYRATDQFQDADKRRDHSNSLLPLGSEHAIPKSDSIGQSLKRRIN